MNFNIGDCVKNNRKKEYNNGDVIEIGTKGVVNDFFGTIGYVVSFDGSISEHWIPKKHLDKC